MGRLYVVARKVRFTRVLAALVFAMLLPLWLQSQQAGDASTLRGTVRDSQGKPVAAAAVQVRAKDAVQPLTTHADSQGNYIFAGLRQGVYSARAEMAGYSAAEVPSLFIGAKEVKTVDFTLLPAKTSSLAVSAGIF